MVSLNFPPTGLLKGNFAIHPSRGLVYVPFLSLSRFCNLLWWKECDRSDTVWPLSFYLKRARIFQFSFLCNMSPSREAWTALLSDQSPCTDRGHRMENQSAQQTASTKFQTCKWGHGEFSDLCPAISADTKWSINWQFLLHHGWIIGIERLSNRNMFTVILNY